MSGIIITVWLLGITLLALMQPVAGPLVYYLIVWMHPEEQMYGGLSLRWTLLIALTSMMGYLFVGKERQTPNNAILFFLVILALWYVLAALANNVDAAEFALATDFVKLIVMSWVTACVINTRARLHALVWIIVICIGSVSFRTGLLTVVTGGGGVILGPDFLGQTNEYARVVIYTWPLMIFLARHSAHYYVRLGHGVLATMAVFTLIGTNSRGALVAFVAMCAVLWMYGNKKIVSALLIVIFVSGAYFVLPPNRLESFTNRTATIENPNEDSSFTSRTNAWAFGWSYALNNPVFGGGPHTFEREHGIASHSSYFEVLGESGFVGLAVYIIIALLAFATIFRIRKRTKGITELIWAHDLAFYIMISLVGYFVGGITKNHGFFEYYYMLLGILMGLETAVNKALAAQTKNQRIDNASFAMDAVPQNP